MDITNSSNNSGTSAGGENRLVTVVRVKGTIHADLADWLEPDEVKFLESGETELQYTDLDQAALYGILVRLRDLGLSLVSVEQK